MNLSEFDLDSDSQPEFGFMECEAGGSMEIDSGKLPATELRLRFSLGREIAPCDGIHDHEPVEMSFADLADRLADPMVGPKGSAGFFLPAVFATGKRGKNDSVEFPRLVCVDLDQGAWTPDSIRAAVSEPIAWVAHTTASHATESPRWHVVFPLDCNLSPEDWAVLARAVARWFGFEVGSQSFDRCAERISQPMYLPTKLAPDSPFVADRDVESPAIADDLASRLIAAENRRGAEVEAEVEKENRARTAARERRAQSLSDVDREPRIIDAYNAAHPIEETLRRNGYVAPRAPGGRWVSPRSAKGLPAVRVFSEEGRFYSHHGSDQGSELESGDSFDLYRIFEHGGDCASAVRGAADELGQHDGLRVSDIEASLPFEPLAPIERHPLKPFPLESMGVVSEFVDALSQTTQTPHDLAGVCALGFMAGAVARKFTVSAGWTEELALYLAVAADPGSRKSEIFKRCARPIEEREAELQKSTAEEVRQNKSRAGLLKKRLKVIEGCYAKAETAADRDDAEKRALDVGRELQEVLDGVTSAPRLLVADVTPERLAGLTFENEERMIFASAEGGQIFDRMGRYSQNGEPNMDLMLSAWSGERCSIDRQNAAPIILQRPVLTVVAAIQLHTLETLATQKAFTGRGLTARFAYSIPRDVRGHRDVCTSIKMDGRAEEAYNLTMRRLLDHPHDRDRPLDLRVEGQALEVFTEFREMMETGQREDGDFEDIKGWASKAPGLVLRIAGVLALAEARRCGDAEISAAIMRRAIELGKYFADHSSRAFEIMGGNTGDPEVDKVWRWISSREDASRDFTRSELWRAVKNGRFRVADDLAAPLDRLVRAGRIARRPVPKTRAGRPPQVWAVNPEALK